MIRSAILIGAALYCTMATPLMAQWPSWPQSIQTPPPSQPSTVSPLRPTPHPLHPAQTSQIWYWCDPANTYYPNVARCPVPWRVINPQQPARTAASPPQSFEKPTPLAPDTSSLTPPPKSTPPGMSPNCLYPKDGKEATSCEEQYFRIKPGFQENMILDLGQPLYDLYKALEKEEEKRQDEARQAGREAEAEKWRTGVRGVVHGVSVVPGAIVCPDFPTVRLMFDWYTTHWSDVRRDQLTHGQSSELNGPPLSEPPFENYGCTLVPSGTAVTMTQMPRKLFPTITGLLPSGRAFNGVTLQGMHTP
jgi:hypothetical protein